MQSRALAGWNLFWNLVLRLESILKPRVSNRWNAGRKGECYSQQRHLVVTALVWMGRRCNNFIPYVWIHKFIICLRSRVVAPMTLFGMLPDENEWKRTSGSLSEICSHFLKIPVSDKVRLTSSNRLHRDKISTIRSNIIFAHMDIFDILSIDNLKRVCRNEKFANVFF